MRRAQPGRRVTPDPAGVGRLRTVRIGPARGSARARDESSRRIERRDAAWTALCRSGIDVGGVRGGLVGKELDLLRAGDRAQPQRAEDRG